MKPVKVIASGATVSVVLALGLVPGVFADIVVWDGGGTNSNWSTANNWHPNQTPIDGDIVRFDGSTRLTPNNNMTGLDAQAIRFRAMRVSWSPAVQSTATSAAPAPLLPLVFFYSASRAAVKALHLMASWTWEDTWCR